MNIEIWSGPVTDELVDAFVRLTPLLSKSNPPPSRAQLTEIVTAGATDQFVARDDDGTIIGVSTLATFRIPTGVRCWIEDVIVDSAARGKGVGEALTNAMLERGKALGAITVDLTSRPSRDAANRLYVRVGFELRETNVYRFLL
jgi:ribosomal protein S18 acetylase RimI-like enzyme